MSTTSTTALGLIAAERQRQIEVEGWTASHDDTDHPNGELAQAAACYALPARSRIMEKSTSFLGDFEPTCKPTLWPWIAEWWKPTPEDRLRELVKAGALIVAEIERLQRKEAQGS